MNSPAQAKQFSYPEGPSRFSSGPRSKLKSFEREELAQVDTPPTFADSVASKSDADSEISDHQLLTARTIDPPVTPVPSITPISSTTTTPPPLTGSLPLIRQRTAQACDKCRERKTKCSGQHPCARCVARGLLCKYSVRESRHRSPHRGIRGSGEEAGSSRGAERSRYIDSSTRVAPENTPNPIIQPNPSVPMPPYRIRPNNPSLSSTPAFAQRNHLDERYPYQRYLSQYNTQRKADLTRPVPEVFETIPPLTDQWQKGSQETRTRTDNRSNADSTKPVAFDARMNGATNDGQLGYNLNRNFGGTTTATPSQSSSRAMYGGTTFSTTAKDDPSSQVRASIEAPSRHGHWNFNIELTQYENAGLQPPIPPSAGLQQYIGTPSWPVQVSSRGMQNYEGSPTRGSSSESGNANESRGGSEYWDQGFSPSGNYEKSYFTPANASNIRGRDEGIGNEFNMQAPANQPQQYQDSLGIRTPFPQETHRQSHYTSSGSFSHELDTPVNDTYNNCDMGYSDTRFSSLGRSHREQSPGPLELNHPMPVTPIQVGTHFASALTMPMHNHLSQFQGLERGSSYNREMNDYNSTSQSHGDGSFDFPPPKTFSTT